MEVLIIRIIIIKVAYERCQEGPMVKLDHTF